MIGWPQVVCTPRRSDGGDGNDHHRRLPDAPEHELARSGARDRTAGSVMSPEVVSVREDEPLAHRVEQRRERVDAGGDEAALDAGHRGLARAGAGGELPLAQTVALSCGAEHIGCAHARN